MNLENKAHQQKLIREVAVLVVVVILIGAVTMFHSGAFNKSAKNVKATKPLDTSFDTNALNAVEQKDKNYPNVTPVSGELGKTDPFAP